MLGDLGFRAALMAGRLAGSLSRRLGAGAGGVIAGHVALRLAPDLLASLNGSLTKGSLLVSGTNGKTTTTAMVAHLCRAAGMEVISNTSGANLISGLAGAMASAASPSGRLAADVAVLEADEGVLPLAVQSISPQYIALTNLFRDQLDRYGEMHSVAQGWRRALETWGVGDGSPGRDEARSLILNADDPSVAAIAGQGRGPTLLYGIAEAPPNRRSSRSAADASLCPSCDALLRYSLRIYSHLGHYSCDRCSFARPEPQIQAKSLKLTPRGVWRFTLATPDGAAPVTLEAPGLFNVYNALAAAACAHLLGIGPYEVSESLLHFRGAFGRLLSLTLDRRRVIIGLVKNPVGLSEVLGSLLLRDGSLPLLFIINDRVNDGRDVSWLWDADLEQAAGRILWAGCAGTRAEDMALRLKYAGLEDSRIWIEREPVAAFREALNRTEPGSALYCLPNYTALLTIQRYLQRHGSPDQG